MGVKSLWSLLTPVGRPVMLETIEGKAMAIDSSIWIYQFQATMRDKDGRALSNAHVLGFLRRISKLLFYGIKPVFVFDGGAPVLKRATITERKKKKEGAAMSHTKLAEKLLAAQMRREAIDHAQQHKSPSKNVKGNSKTPAGPVQIDENTVYLEDVDPSMSKTPARKAAEKPADPSSSSKKKAKFYDHDPYKLPEVDLDAVVAKATRATVPDPRLATEEELRAFIEDMRPEDFDVTSEAFRELPTEVQYEIVGDLRLKSRQTSYKRLEAMLKNSRTPLDFSRQQIKNLKQRNALTQQFWMTTDSIGQAHMSIPVRIASERNKEYVLMKNEGDTGGWILGIRDDGTQAKPIEIDHSDDEAKEEDGDSEVEMEEVSIRPGLSLVDPDLQEYRRGNALAAIAKRYSPKKLAPLTTAPIQRKGKGKPLFDLDDEEMLELPRFQEESDEDEDMALAIQESLDQARATKAAEAGFADASMSTNAHASSSSSAAHSSPTKPNTSRSSSSRRISNEGHAFDDDDDNPFKTSTRLETALSIANAGPLRNPLSLSDGPAKHTSSFGRPTSLLGPLAASISPPQSAPSAPGRLEGSPSKQGSLKDAAASTYPVVSVPLNTEGTPPSPMASLPALVGNSEPASDDDMEEVLLPVTEVEEVPHPVLELPMENAVPSPAKNSPPAPSKSSLHSLTSQPHQGDNELTSLREVSPQPVQSVEQLQPAPALPLFTPEPTQNPDLDEEFFMDWSRSPSPTGDPAPGAVAPVPSSPKHDTWDAAQEMDPHAEQGEFAKFMSQVKGKDLDDVRREIDDEIKSLNKQKKVAMRDSEDITQQMISQIMMMLRLFGIPYITAPMEAEAQCAELVTLGLVDGVITDDSDVFLFGAQRVFKNMFNQSKTVECFLSTDLGRELGLDRDTLIRLAYLLGSDYVEGLPGVGPVVAMELLKEFPGPDGLHKFKEWWMRVQTGKDNSEDTNSAFRKRFKKKFKSLYLPPEWPNLAVRDAYYHPAVDSSDEPFKWGLPDLDALRDFFREELGWQKGKVDDLLLPIIKKMGKRGQAEALNKQGNLNEFFAVTEGTGTHAPRKRQAYTSKRLQQVVSEFRNQQTKTTSAPASSAGSDVDSDAEAERPKKKARSSAKAKGSKNAGARAPRGQAGRGRQGRASGKRKAAQASDSEDEYAGGPGHDATVQEASGTPLPPLRVTLRPRPKPVRGGASNVAHVE